MKKSKWIFVLAFIAVVTLGAACNSNSNSGAAISAATTIKNVQLNDLNVTLSCPGGQIRHGDQDLTLSFTDQAGKPVEVGAVSLNFHMPAMGSMGAMNNPVTLTTTDTPGVYRGKVRIEMVGEWQAQLAYEGPSGNGKTSFRVTAQ